MLEKIQNRTQKNYAIIIGLLVAIILSIFVFDLFFGTRAESNIKPYYSGDAVSYNNQIVISSTDTGYLELFKFSSSDNSITRFATAESSFKDDSIFTSSVLNVENGNLYVYAVDGRYLYKYDASNLSYLVLVKKEKDNSWEWFMGLRKTDNKVATIGTKEVKIWNNDVLVVNAYANKDKNFNLNFSKDGRYLFNVQTNYNLDKENDFLEIINTQTRQIIAKEQIILEDSSLRQVYSDSVKNLTYIAGDRVLKQINLSTAEVKNFKHNSNFGYDVAGINGADHFYFSDGVGIVKMTHNLEAADWVYINTLGINNSWAMHLVPVMDKGVEKLVVFNNSNIAILNSNLDLITYHEATEEDLAPSEPLILTVDKNRAPSNSQVSLRATGFAPSEKIVLTFSKPQFSITGRMINGVELSRVIVTTDDNGRFSQLLTVPAIPERTASPYSIDIVAEGQTSQIRYSVGFLIE